MAAEKRGRNSSSGHYKKEGTAKKKTDAKKTAQSTNPELRDEIILILFFVFCTLMLLSCFGVCGSFGNVVSMLLFGLFGYAAYIFPVLLFAGSCFYAANRERTAAVIKCAASVAAVPVLCGLLHAFFGDHTLETVGSAYGYCALNHNGGGVIGAGIYAMLVSAFGTAGVYVVLTALLIIAAVIISEKSFVKGVKKGSRKVYDSAKEETMRRKERVEEKRAEKRREKKISGVNMDVKLPEKEAHMQIDMTELPNEAEEEEIPIRISPDPVLAQAPGIPKENPVCRKKKIRNF